MGNGITETRKTDADGPIDLDEARTRIARNGIPVGRLRRGKDDDRDEQRIGGPKEKRRLAAKQEEHAEHKGKEESGMTAKGPDTSGKLEIIVHARPHGDEFFAAALPILRPNLADSLMPGLSQARVRVEATTDTREELEARAKGGSAVLLGFGNPALPNVFNEHGGLERDTCTAKIFAGKLGILEDLLERPIWASLLQDIYEVDAHGAGTNETLLPQCVRTWELRRDDGVAIEQIMQVVVEDLERLLRDEAYKAKTTGKHEEIKIGNFSAWFLPPLDPADPVDNKEVWRAKKDGACLIVAPSTKGHINLILGNNKSAKGFPRRSFMRRISAMVRAVEAVKRGREIPINLQNIEALFAPGVWPLAPEWYLDPRTWQLFNGALSHPGLAKTEIKPEEMKNIVRHAWDDEFIKGWIATHFWKEYVSLVPGIRH